MDLGDNSYQDFFNDLHNHGSPRDLQQIFEKDEKPIRKDSKTATQYQQNSNQQFSDKLHNHAGSRNLQQIFEDDNLPLRRESKNTLRYQPDSKKQTTSGTETHSDGKGVAKPAERWSTVLAKVAYCYNGSENVGRVGVALSRSSLGGVKLIIYKSQNNILTTLLIGPKGNNVILRESYMQFYDSEHRFWSVSFDSQKDEQDFTKAMHDLGLNVDRVSNEQRVEQAKISETNTPTSSPLVSSHENVKTAAEPPQPQPRPRQFRDHAPPCDSSSEEISQDAVSNVSESSQSPTVSLPNIKSEEGLAIFLESVATQLDGNKFSNQHDSSSKTDDTSNEQHNKGVMEQKMDAILKAMTFFGNKQIPSSPDIKPYSTSPLHDNEDELLELEQKLLNLKKENRMLVKSLKAKDQALNEYRSSTCTRCKELLLQNKELEIQNRALHKAVTDQVDSANKPHKCSCQGVPAECVKCEQSAEKILKQEKYILELQNLLRHYQEKCIQPGDNL